jgi:hypothetical protein
LAAIVSNNSKASAPTTTYAYMWWADTANDILKQRNAADSAWINILTLSTGAPLGALAASLVSGTHTNFTSTGIDDNATSTAITIDASGNVLMGTSTLSGMQTGNIDDATALYQGQIAATNSDGNYSAYLNKRTSTGGGFVRFNYNGSTKGSITTNGTSTAYNTSSDYRLKELDVPMEGSIDRLKLLRPINFAWKVDGTRTDGFLAHEAGEVVPECATGTKDAMMDEEYEVTPAVMDGETVVTEAVMGTRSVPDYQGIDQAKLVPLLVSALQEAIARIEVLENA